MKRMLTIMAVAVLGLSAWAQGRYAVVNVSAANLRAEPDYESPLETQALLGAAMEVLDSSSYWLKVRCMDPDYVAWVNRLQVARMSSLDDYEVAPKLIVTAKYSMLYSSPSGDSPVLRDLVRGDLLVDGGTVRRGMRRVLLPDGTAGWMPRRDAADPATLSASREAIVAEAMSYLGTPYLWGGTTVKGFDCSGLVRQCYLMAGISLPRNASEQLLEGSELDVSHVLEGQWGHLLPGDLLFFGNRETGRVSHVAIYVGDGHIVHSSMIVRCNSLLSTAPDYYENSHRLLYARRILP